MGAAASIEAFQSLTDEKKAEYQTKYESYIAEGKTDDEALELCKSEAAVAAVEAPPADAPAGDAPAAEAPAAEASAAEAPAAEAPAADAPAADAPAADAAAAETSSADAPPAFITTFYNSGPLDDAKLAAMGEAFTDDGVVEFAGEFAPKDPEGNPMIMPKAAVVAVLGLLKAGFSDFQFNTKGATFAKREDGSWAADIIVAGTHDGSYTFAPEKVPAVEASGKLCEVGPETFALFFNEEGKVTKQTITPLHEGPSGPPGFYILAGGKLGE